MQETLYKLIFEGKIQPDQKEKTVRKNLQILFNADKEKMERLFSGDPMIVRKNLPEDKIRQYEKAMVKAGGVCRILPVKGGDDLPPLSPQALAVTNNKTPETTFNTKLSNTKLSNTKLSNTKLSNIKHPINKQSIHWINRIGRTQFLALLWITGWLEVFAWLLPEYLPQLIGSMTIQERLMVATGFHTLAGLSFIFIISLRLHDMDRSAWLWVYMLIPGLNLLFLFWLTFGSGSQSGNSYGTPPSQPGNFARLFGFWIPLLIVLSTGGSAWFHQDELLQLVSTLPEEIMQYSSF